MGTAAALPAGRQRASRQAADRQVIDGISHRGRTDIQWHGDLLERSGPWRAVCERHWLWPADGTWQRPLQRIQAASADAAGDVDRDISVDSTIVRARQHPVGAARGPRPVHVTKSLPHP
ncbi:transposase [Streptomyces sp. NPDC002133]|uniref:transposase n=1 Tax=Streptomyces sp. NPDC002133 TaxID=3154409 RepID=UPI003333265E